MNAQLVIQLQEQIDYLQRVENDEEDGEPERILDSLLECAKRGAGVGSPEYGLVLRVLASFHRNHGDDDRALQIYREALKLIRKAGDDGVIYMALTLASITSLCQRLGRSKEGTEAERAAIDLVKRFAEDPQRYTFSYEAGDVVTQGTFTETMAVLTKTLASARSAESIEAGLSVFDRILQGKAHVAMRLAILITEADFRCQRGIPADAAFQHAWKLADSGDLAANISLSQWVSLGEVALYCNNRMEAIKIAKRLCSWPKGGNSGEYVDAYAAGLSLDARAALCKEISPEAESKLRLWLGFSTSTYGPATQQTADCQVELGKFLINQNRASEAVSLLRYAAATRSSSSAAPVLLGEAYFHLAEALDQSDDDIQAMTYYQYAFRVYASSVGSRDLRAVTAALNSAEVARVSHDYDSAEFWFRYVLRVEKEKAGSLGSNYAHALNNLAETLLEVDRLDEAAELSEEALGIRKELHGATSPQYDRSLGVVARIAFKRGDRVRFNAALREFVSFSNDGTAAMPLEVVLGYLESEGRFSEAIEETEAALQDLEDSKQAPSGSTTPNQRIALRFQIARLYAHQKNSSQAIRYMLDAFEIESTFLSDQAGYRSQRQMHDILAESRSRFAMLLDVLTQQSNPSPQHVRATYEVLQQRKSMETRLLALQRLSFIGDRALTSVPQEALAEVRDQVADLVASLRTARESWLKVLLDHADTPQTEADVTQLRAHRDQVEAYERALASYVGQGSWDWAVMGPTSKTPNLEAGEAVVEYFLAESSIPVFYAFLVLGDSVRIVPLGDADGIRQGVHQLRDQVAGSAGVGEPDPPWLRRARFLSNRLLRPLLSWLGDVKKIYFVPDSDLFVLPFDLLPLDSGQLAIDRWTITYLWNGGEKRGFRVFLGNPPSPDTSVVISQDFRSRFEEHQEWHFAPLPSATTEGEAVAKKIGGLHLTGPDATKAAVMRCERPEILHFASHSFYIPTADDRETMTRGQPDTALYRARAALEDPLHRIGIALQGADLDLIQPSATSPGILFATDVIDLDLRDTDLVVLSSCQSGLGDRRPGDGIHGFRRAFRAAGAKSVISSLWKIPDDVTCNFMLDLYDRLLAQMPRGEAIRAAKLALRENHPNDPFFWAGFVLDGSDSPLFRFDPMCGLKFANTSGVAQIYGAGLQYASENRWNDAIESFEFVVNSRAADDKLRAEAGYERAGIFRKMGRFQQALEAYNLLIQDFRTPSEIRDGAVADRALTKLMLGDAHGSYLDYTAALAKSDLLPTRRARLLVNRGFLLGLTMNDVAGAMEDWAEVLRLDDAPLDQRLMALQNRADLLRKTKNYEAAILEAKNLIAMPDSKGSRERENTWLILALCLTETGKLSEAMEAVRAHINERESALPFAGTEVLTNKTAKELTDLIGLLIQVPTLPSCRISS